MESAVITMIYPVVCKVGSSTQTRETVKIQIGSRSLDIIFAFLWPAAQRGLGRTPLYSYAIWYYLLS